MIIFLYGQDSFRSNQKVAEIKNKFIKEVDPTSINITFLDGASLKFEEFNHQIKATPFLSRKRLIIIKNLINKNKAKEIAKEIVELLDAEKKNADQDNIIVFWEIDKKDKKKTKGELWKRLTKEKFAQEFKLLTPYELHAWIITEVKKHQGQIDSQAVFFLAATIGNDLWQMSNELDKLLSYKKGELITVADIENLVKANFDDDIFKLIDALSARNKKVALKLISDQLSLGTNELALLATITRHFRILLLIKDWQKTEPRISEAEIAKNLHIHPYVAKKALNQVNNFTLDQLKHIYNKLLDIDLKIKTSAAKPKTIFELFIAQI